MNTGAVLSSIRVRGLVVAGALLSGNAWAADAPSEQAQADARRSEAKARYEQGVEAYSAGRFKDSVDHFLAADQLSPSAPLSFNIARAYEKLGDDSGALRWYRDYLRRAPSAPNAADVGARIAGYEQGLAKKGVQQLTVLSTPVGATVTIDGSPVGVTPWTGDIPPGKHKVELTLRGYSDVTNELDFAPEHAQDLTLRLTEAPGRADAPAAAPGPVTVIQQVPAADRGREEKGGFGVLPIVVLGAGGAVLGGALTFEMLRRGSEREAKREPTQVGYKEKLDAMESRRTTARVLAGIGGGLVLAGGALLVVDLVTSKPERKTAWLGVGLAPGGASLRGSF
jgi:tetratricopeptide (TPR) repeat protein